MRARVEVRDLVESKKREDEEPYQAQSEGFHVDGGLYVEIEWTGGLCHTG